MKNWVNVSKQYKPGLLKRNLEICIKFNYMVYNLNLKLHGKYTG